MLLCTRAAADPSLTVYKSRSHSFESSEGFPDNVGYLIGPELMHQPTRAVPVAVTKALPFPLVLYLSSGFSFYKHMCCSKNANML